MRSGVATQNNVYNVYDNETAEALEGTVTAQLPALALASNPFKGAGMAGEVNIPVPGSMTPQQASLAVPVIYGALTKYMELGTVRTLDLRNEIIVVNKDTHNPEKVPNRWVIKAILSKSDPGKVEQAATSEASLEMQVVYMHHWQDGEDILEWDPFKLIYTVNGKDLLEETRQNILA